MESKDLLGSNDVLVGHTTVCEAARLISKTKPKTQDADGYPSYATKPLFQLLELFSLIEAVVLHDTLFSLPGELPSDVNDLELRNRLMETGILKEYSPSNLYREIIPETTQWVKDAAATSVRMIFENLGEQAVQQLGEREFEQFEDFIATKASPRLVFILSRLMNRDMEDEIDVPEDEDYCNNVNKWALGVNDVADPVGCYEDKIQSNPLIFGENGILQTMAGRIGNTFLHMGSGNYQNGLSLLRTIMYWQVADAIRLPWYPDVMRIPILITLDRKLRSSVADQVYNIVANAFGTTVDELLTEDLPYEAMIPPLTTLLLSRCSRREDVISELITLREEFSDFRKKIRDLEENRRNAKSIKELRAARAKIKKLFKAVATKYDKQNQTMVDTLFGYAPNVLKLLKNPLDPEQYTSEFFQQPYEWIKNWWCSRPASRLFKVTNKLEELELYGQLLPRVFGVEIAASDADFIRKHYSRYESNYQ